MISNLHLTHLRKWFASQRRYPTPMAYASAPEIVVMYSAQRLPSTALLPPASAKFH
ncbi:hypothetical protein KCP73_15765 [Salmonella enterica subsp. enterica]|nr:hypothetical protein KCP73_15765 [Salmonella enterica subsp. enterica]